MPHARAGAAPAAIRHDARSALVRLCERYYPLAAAATLLLAAVNVGARLGREVVTDWDEALYAITAWEALQSGDWIGTTFQGQIDYYNSKPPLNVWLLALAFDWLGPGLVPLRLVSAAAAWLAVAVLLAWTPRLLGRAQAIVSAAVLATSFGFLYVHSGRSGNADALFALLVLLAVVTLWAERDRPWRRVWLGPICAGLFLLKGMGVLMPLLVIAVALAALGRRERERLLPSLAAAVLFALPCAAWAAARWSVDGPAFFETMARNDLIRISTEVLDGHAGSPLYYLHVLQKDHYEWLAAGAVALALVPPGWARIRAGVRSSQALRLLAAWAAVCLLVPTLMQTKLPWYLNPFYPAFALGVGWIVTHALTAPGSGQVAFRRRVVLGVTIAALCVAEAKLVWYSFRVRDVDLSPQGLLIAERDRLDGARVFRHEWSNADLFVLRAIARAEAGLADTPGDFLHQGGPGDYFMAPPGTAHPGLRLVAERQSFALYSAQGRP